MKWLLIVAVVLAVIVLGVTAVGMALPQNHVAQRSVHFSANPEKIWAVITDVPGYPRWRSEVAAVQMLSTDAGQVAWREVSAKGNKLSFEATTSEPPSHPVTLITDKGIPFGGSWDYRIVPDGTGSRITITENGEVYNPIFRFVSKYIMGHTSTLDTYLSSLAAKLGETYTGSGN